MTTSAHGLKDMAALKASGAVRCESGIRSSTSSIKLHLAYPGRMQQPTEKVSRRKRSRSPLPRSRNDCRLASSTRPTDKPRIINRVDENPPTWLSKAANQASCMKSSASRDSDLRNPIPKLELSQETSIPTSQQQQQPAGTCRSGSSKYDVAVLAITHDLVHYAEAVLAQLNRRAIEEGGIRVDQQRQQPNEQEALKLHFRSPRVKIMVLLSVDHIAPCMQDLGEEGILFALLLNNANMTHNSCTLRILHSPTQQEHRNMPLPDAVDLLLKDFAEYLEANAVVSTNNVPKSKAKSPLLALPLPQKEPQQQQPPPPQQHQPSQQQNEEHGHRHHHCCRHRQRHLSSSSLSSCNSASSSSSIKTASSSANSFRHPQHPTKLSKHQKRPRSHQHHHRPQQHNQAKEETGLLAEASAVEGIPAPDDPNFLAPSRHVAVLLRMLADSRILSVGELDEICAFISQRRSRLTSEFTTAAEPLVYYGSSSSQLYVDTSEALRLSDAAMSSAGEMIFTPNFDPATSESFHREALCVSRYRKVFVNSPSRRHPQYRRDL